MESIALSRAELRQSRKAKLKSGRVRRVERATTSEFNFIGCHFFSFDVFRQRLKTDSF